MTGAKKISKIAGAALAFVCAWGTLAGCTPGPEKESQEERYTSGVVTKSKDREYWMSV